MESRTSFAVFYRLAVLVLLLGILITQVQLLRATPPTLGEVMQAEGEAKTQLLKQRPLVYANVSNTVDVTVTNEPLAVEQW